MKILSIVCLFLMVSLGFAEEVKSVTLASVVTTLRADLKASGSVRLWHPKADENRPFKTGDKPRKVAQAVAVDGENWFRTLASADPEERDAALYIGSKPMQKLNAPVLAKMLIALQKAQTALEAVEPSPQSKKFEGFALKPSIAALKEIISNPTATSQEWTTSARVMVFYFDAK